MTPELEKEIEAVAQREFSLTWLQQLIGRVESGDVELCMVVARDPHTGDHYELAMFGDASNDPKGILEEVLEIAMNDDSSEEDPSANFECDPDVN